MRLPIGRAAMLWTLQVLLAVFFALASGAPKLLLPPESLPLPIALESWFVRLIGVAEVLGALGLLLPGIARLVLPGITGPALPGMDRLALAGSVAADRRLSAAAASSLVLLTACATVYQLLARQPESAAFAACMGALCAIVAVARWRPAPPRSSTAPAAPLRAPSPEPI
jgi:hypothetical protein